MASIEYNRLREAHENGQAWYRWGPYLSERQWGTVREDYSPGGTAWDFLPHDQARSHAYRWGEDGLLAACRREQNCSQSSRSIRTGVLYGRGRGDGREGGSRPKRGEMVVAGPGRMPPSPH